MDEPFTDPAPEVPTPALLRASRGAYSIGIRRELLAAGIEDMPPNGPFIVGGLGNRGAAATDLLRQLGASKQSTSQLVDTLVSRGFLERKANPTDRRRIDLELTPRGATAAEAVRRGVESVEQKLKDKVGPAQHAGLRASLVALCSIRESWEDEAHK
jgi:DNA-binding MarR family transcriptional regulator